MTSPTDNPYIRDSDGPWLRRYLNWARPYYDRYPPGVKEQVIAIDRWLYSRRSIGTLVGIAASMGGTMLGLYFAGANWILAVVLTAVVFFVCLVAGFRAWVGPDFLEKISNRPSRPWLRNPWVFAVYLPLLGYLGAQLGFVIGRAARHPEQITPDQLLTWAMQSLVETTPFAMALVGLVIGVVAITLFIKQHRLKIQVERLSLQSQVAASTSLALQAQLKVMQAQIKPHFLFNTLAALQHWTDTQDPRASDMLRSLTSFLRRSTDAMDSPMVALATELDLARDYLSIMQHRLGKKLQFKVDATSACAGCAVPPAMVLSLVENAVEHGIEPSLSGGFVEVAAEVEADVEGSWLVIRVSDDGVGASQIQEGIGLTNTRSRLKAHFGDEATLSLDATSGGFAATVRIRQVKSHPAV